MQLLSALSTTVSPIAMQATPVAGMADAFAALFAGLAPVEGDGRQVAAEPGKPLPVAPPPATVVAAPAIAEMPVAPVLPVSATEAVTLLPDAPVPVPVAGARDAVPVVLAAGVVSSLKLLPEEQPAAVPAAKPRPEQLVQQMPARFAAPMPVRARRPAEEPALPTPTEEDAEPAEDGEAPIAVAPTDAPPADLPPLVAIPADKLAPVPDSAEPAMKIVGPTPPDDAPLPDAPAPRAGGRRTARPAVIDAVPAAVGPGAAAPTERTPVAGDRSAPSPSGTAPVPRSPVVADVTAPQMPASAPNTTPMPRSPVVVEGAAPQRASSAPDAAPMPETPVVAQGTVPQAPSSPAVADGPARRTAPPPAAVEMPTGHRRMTDDPSPAPVDVVSAPVAPRRFAPLAPGTLPGRPVIDPVRPVLVPDGETPTVSPEAGQASVAPVIADPVVRDMVAAAQGFDRLMTATPAAPAPAPTRVAQAVDVPGTMPLAALGRSVPNPLERKASAATAPKLAEPGVQPVIAEPVVRAPIVDAAPRPVDAAGVLIDQPDIPFTLPTERPVAAQPVAEPLTPLRQTIAGEASAPVVPVAAPAPQPVKAPPVTRLAAPIAPEPVAEAVIAETAAPRPRREDDAPALATPVTATFEPATPRPVAATAAPVQPNLDTRQPQWMEGMIDRIETLRDSGATQNETRIRLSPDALGDVEIAIRTSDDGRVHVHFNSENADAGRLLADAQPRLLQLAEARGLKLGGMQVDVSTQQQPSSSQRQAQDQGGQPNRAPRSAFADTGSITNQPDNRIA